MYKEIKANIWGEKFEDDIKVITTNGQVFHGKAVMGAGLALDARLRYDLLPTFLAINIMLHGNHCYYFPRYKIITFPTKNSFWDKSDYDLIKQSMIELYDICCKEGIKRVIFPHVGCKNGKLKWESVKRVIVDILKTEEIEFIVVEE